MTLENKKRIVFFTKGPIDKYRIESLEKLLLIPNVIIAGIFVEEVVHLFFRAYLALILKRIIRGNIYLPEFIKKVIVYNYSSAADKDTALKIDGFAKKNNINLYRVKNIESKESIALVKSLNPDLGIIFGHRVLKEDLFSIPKNGCVNVHYGILPRYAGMEHSTFWALTENARQVGLTIHRVDNKIDHGDIILIKYIPAYGKKVAVLEKEIRAFAPDALKEAVISIVNGKANYYSQDYSVRKYWKAPGFFVRMKYRKYI